MKVKSVKREHEKNTREDAEEHGMVAMEGSSEAWTRCNLV
jgi:hypothetical protein